MQKLKVYEVIVSFFVPAFTEEGARKHIEENSFHNHILEIKEIPYEEDIPSED